MTRERITTYGLFCLPGFIAYCVFLIFPILMGIYYSFMDWNGISKSYNFIGFANYYSIPASCPTAREGKWVKSPGKALFKRVEKALPELKIVAED